MITCIIIEDQPPAQRLLQKYIHDIGTLNLKGTFADALEAMSFLKNKEVDLIFLDIHLPKISGINFLKIVSNNPHIILTTAFSEYALESYEYNVSDYLLKPYSFERFVKAVSKIEFKTNKETLKNSNKEIRQDIFIKSGYEHIRIPINNIIYIKSDTDYTEIFLSDKKHLSYESLNYWTTTLPETQFIRVHKSYIINFSKIEKVVTNIIHLTDNTKIPIGRVYKEELMSRITK